MPLPVRQPFYFIRHGQTDDNHLDRIQDDPAIPLNATGLDQAQSVARQCKHLPLAFIASSPTRRALMTAESIAVYHPALTVQTYDGLRERDPGAWRGRSWAAIRQAYPHLFTEGQPSPIAPDSETFAAMAVRVLETLTAILTPPRPAGLVVSHGGVFRALTLALVGQRLKAENALPYLFTPPTHPADKTWQVSVALPTAHG